MEQGVIIGKGTPEECITTEVIDRIYHAQARLMDVELEPGLTKRICVSMNE